MFGICLLVCIAVALAEPGRNTVGTDKPMEEIKPKALPVWENEGMYGNLDSLRQQ